MKFLLASIAVLPFCCFAQKLDTYISRITGDTIYSTKLQPIGGFGSAELSLFKKKDSMQLELLKLVNKGNRFGVIKGAQAYVTTIDGITDTLFASETSDPKLVSQGYTTIGSGGQAGGRNSVWSFTPTYFLTEKDIKLLSKQSIKLITLVTTEGNKDYPVKEKRSDILIEAFSLFK